MRQIADNQNGSAFKTINEIAEELVVRSPPTVTQLNLPEIDDIWPPGLETSLNELHALITQSIADHGSPKDQGDEQSAKLLSPVPKANALGLNEELKRIEPLLVETLQKDQHLADEIEAVQAALNYNRASIRLEEVRQELTKLRQESSVQTVDVTKHRPLKQLDARIKTCQEKLRKVQFKGHELRHQLREDATTVGNIKLIPRIDAILFHERMYFSEEEAIDQLSRRIRELESRLESEQFLPARMTGRSSTSQGTNLPSMDELQHLAGQVKQAKSEMTHAQSSLRETENVARDTSFASSQLGATELRPLQDAERHAERLRHQLDIHSQYHDLSSEHQDVNSQVQRMHARQLMSFQMTMIFALPFTVGVAIVIYNLYMSSNRLNLGYVLLGFTLATVTAILKLFLDHVGGNLLQTFQKRLVQIESELTQITDEYDKSELDNPVSRNSLIEKLSIAKQKLDTLRESLDEKRTSPPVQTAIEDLPEIMIARQQLQEKQLTYREAINSWRRFLVETGLSPKLSLSAARIELAQLAAAQSPIPQDCVHGNDLLLRQMRSDLERRHHNLENVCDTVRNLLRNLGFSGSSRSIREQMDILREILGEKRDQLRHRRRLQQSLNQLSRRKKRSKLLGEGSPHTGPSWPQHSHKSNNNVKSKDRFIPNKSAYSTRKSNA